MAKDSAMIDVTVRSLEQSINDMDDELEALRKSTIALAHRIDRLSRALQALAAQLPFSERVTVETILNEK